MSRVSAVGAGPRLRIPWRRRGLEAAASGRLGERGRYDGEGGEGRVPERGGGLEHPPDRGRLRGGRGVR